MWKKLKWWHWGLILLFVSAGIGAIIDPPERKSAEPQPKRYASPDAEFRLISNNSFFAMTFNQDADPDALPEIAREHCGSRTFCTILGWTDPTFAARGMPLTDREASKQVFYYQINRSTGFEIALWSCDKWPRTSRNECMSALDGKRSTNG